MGKDNEFSSRTADEDTELYAIESIVGKRIIRGKTHYLVKWRGYDSAQNSFEPIENFSMNPEVIEEYEQSVARHDRKRKRMHLSSEIEIDLTHLLRLGDPPLSSNVTAEEYVDNKHKQKKGFDRLLGPEKIIDLAMKSNKKMLLIKWKNVDDAEWVPSSEAKVNCPNMVLEFYEANIDWSADDIEMETK